MRPKHRLPPLSPPLNRVQLVKGVQWLEEGQAGTLPSPWLSQLNPLSGAT